MSQQAAGPAASATVVVLGAGINGAALARELLLSGVSVAVVDAGDIASGATAWSTRLVHGGLRYLEYGEVALVRESLVERDRLTRLAPHLVRPLEFYLPVETRLGGLWAAAARLVGLESLARRWRGSRGRGCWTVGIGLTLYDLLSVGSRWPWHRLVRAGAAGMPQVDAGRFPFAAVYADAQMLFPERFTVELFVDARRIAAESAAQTVRPSVMQPAAQFAVFTHYATRLLPDGRLRIEPVGRRRDGATAVELQPAAIINATGAWVDRTLDGLLPGAGERRLIGGTKGSHLVLAAPALRAAIGDRGVYAEAADGRPVFVLPFGERLVLVGTTDIPFVGDPADARTDDDEITYLLAAVARIFPAAAADRETVVQHYCGVRPLPSAGQGSGAPGSITRRHMLVRHPAAGVPFWSIVGGKLTTCRSLAEAAAAEVLGCLGLPVLATSRERPLPGSCAGPACAAAESAAAMHAEAAGLPVDRARRVARATVALFGSRGPEICAAMRPADAADRLLIHGTDLPLAAVWFCVREEWAVSLDDLIERRLMLAFDAGLTRAAIEEVAEALVQMEMLPRELLAEEVAACIGRLRERCGKIVDSGV
jgi:glycerol-3-phosphate dehydrogenase